MHPAPNPRYGIDSSGQKKNSSRKSAKEKTRLIAFHAIHDSKSAPSAQRPKRLSQLALSLSKPPGH